MNGSFRLIYLHLIVKTFFELCPRLDSNLDRLVTDLNTLSTAP